MRCSNLTKFLVLCSDNMFPALGFGARMPDGNVSHEFPLVCLLQSLVFYFIRFFKIYFHITILKSVSHSNVFLLILSALKSMLEMLYFIYYIEG